MIFYFSGTGNTRWAAQQLAESTKEQLLFIPDELKGECIYELRENERLGFRIREDDLDASRLFHERFDHRSAVGSRNILRNTRPKILSLADIDDFPEFVFELIYSRRFRQFFEQVFVDYVRISNGFRQSRLQKRPDSIAEKWSFDNLNQDYIEKT